MDQITIKITVSRQSAIRRALQWSGRADYPAAAVLAALTEEERDYLAGWGVEPIELDVEPTDEALIARIRELAAKARDERAAKAAKLEATRARVLDVARTCDASALLDGPHLKSAGSGWWCPPGGTFSLSELGFSPEASLAALVGREPEVKAELDRRRELAEEKERARKAADAERERAAEAAEEANVGAIDAWVRENASKIGELADRWVDGWASREEVARARLLPLFPDLPRYVRIEQLCSCCRSSFEVADHDGTLTPSQYRALRELTEALERVPELAGADVTVRSHVGTSSCGEEETKLGARVVVEWAGQSVAREYAL